MLEAKNLQLKEREIDLEDQKEELQSQKEELTAAIEELVSKNNSLTEALQTLKQRNEELDQILYRTSHDLKTPVSSLEGLLDLLANEGLSSPQKTLHEHMQSKVEQMQSLLRSLTMLSQASFEDIKSEISDLPKIVLSVLDELRLHPNYNSTSIKTNYSITEFRIDNNLLRIVFKSLLSNALTFRAGKREGLIEISCGINSGSLEITITDDGDGIPVDLTPKIFDMFFRGSERSQGAGLGLYIVKNIINRMKGEISMICKFGKTTFQIVLPEVSAD